MKIGLHLSMLCKEWTDDPSVYLEELKDAGCQGVEVSLFGTTPERLAKVLSKANTLEMDIFCGTGVNAANDPSSENLIIRKEALKYLKQCIDIAAGGNAKAVQGVLYAPWQAFSNEPKEKRWENSAKVLRRAAEYAEAKGICLHVEVINRFESDFMNTLEEGTTFLKKVGHKNVKLLADVFHMNIEENEIYKALEKNISNIGCIHVCENHRGVPGSGHIIWKKFIKTLRNLDYEGYLIMETFTETGTQIADGMKIWRQIGENTPVEEAKKGIRFLRAQEMEE